VKVLLDTCTLAELRKSRPDAAVVAAVSAIPDEKLFLSVVSLGEIVKGIGLLAPGKRRTELTAWLAALQGQFSERILPIDVETGKVWGELTARAQKKGLVVHAADGLIAATALRHSLHVMTRNEGDFKAAGARIVNPWQGKA
jgi:predicted nucleic acid-binding protein